MSHSNLTFSSTSNLAKYTKTKKEDGDMKTKACLSKWSWFQVALIVWVILGWGNVLVAQVSAGGTPFSFSATMPEDIHTVTLGSVDVAALLAEDELEAQEGAPVPFRFGFPFEVDLGLDNAGTWTELPNGDRLWRLRLVSPGAYSINLIYDELWLPEGAKFFIYNEDQSDVLGAFTESNNKDYGKFATGPVKGGVSMLEYYEPADVQGSGVLHISRVVHAYRNVFNKDLVIGLNKGDPSAPTTQGYGDSGSCNRNINCPEGAPWANEGDAVVMILTSGGTRLCSGALVNNVSQDYTPYMLTAFHCIDTNGDETLSASEKSAAAS